MVTLRTKMEHIEKLVLPPEIASTIANCRSITMPCDKSEFIDLALGGAKNHEFSVTYNACGKDICEAVVTRCKNGVAVNFAEDAMRRRDPNCLVVADKGETSHPRYHDVFGGDYTSVRRDTLTWLKTQDLVLVPFYAGGAEYGYEALLIAPKNASFFALTLAELQEFADISKIEGKFTPRAIIFVAPPFRHTHFCGKQVVVHNRKPNMYEMFAYNLYPGPSAKKGVYGFLLEAGEKSGFTVLHASSAKIITPYENEIVIMHEGASGGGKSEMREPIHKEQDGKIVVAKNIFTGERKIISLDETCQLQPISDDMTMCHSKMQNDSKHLVIKDAEDGWFLRVDQTRQYGTEPLLEKLTIHPPKPLVFLNIEAVPNSTCLIWQHTKDSSGAPCSNPRVVLPRNLNAGIINKPTEVDVRSFGVRTPPCYRGAPSYGIIGMLQILPPAIAWLWRLVAPRGHNNPSINSKSLASKRRHFLESEGVGSYAPFLTGSVIKQANLLLEQILSTPRTRYVLFPNQHIGCYEVGFMPQWISREFIARKGGIKFNPDQLYKARCPLLGYGLESMKVDGQFISKNLLRPELQSEVGTATYDAGARELTQFFKDELSKYLVPDLNPIGAQIINLCLNDATLEQYLDVIPMKY